MILLWRILHWAVEIELAQPWTGQRYASCVVFKAVSARTVPLGRVRRHRGVQPVFAPDYVHAGRFVDDKVLAASHSLLLQSNGAGSVRM